MYISKLTLNPERSATRKIVGQPRALHGMVQKAFHEDTGRILWKLDLNGRDPVVYVLSPEKPSTEHIVENYGRANDTRGSATKDYTPVLSLVEEGRKFKFHVPVNPTITINKKRVPVVGDNNLIEWFITRSEPNGFKICGEETPKLAISGAKIHLIPKGEKTVTLNEVVFAGELEVTNVNTFKEMLVNGLGRGKAYGLGFMTLGS